MLDRDGYLSPALLQIFGIILLIASLAYWAVTQHESALFVGAALGLIGLGSAGGAIVTVRQEVREKADEHLVHLERSAQSSPELDNPDQMGEHQHEGKP